MARRHLIDWKFLAMLCVMLLVMVACWGFVARQKQVDDLITISQRATEDARDARADQKAADARAAEQTAALRRQVAALQRQGRRDAARQRALFDYLRERGIAVPQSLAPRSAGDGGGGGGSGPKAQGPRGPQSSPTGPTGPASPTPTPTPGPTPSLGVLDPVCGLLPGLCR